MLKRKIIHILFSNFQPSWNFEQVRNSRNGKPPEKDVVDGGDQVDGDHVVGEEQARSLLQLALEDLEQGARLHYCAGVQKVRLEMKGFHVGLISILQDFHSPFPGALPQAIAST